MWQIFFVFQKKAKELGKRKSFEKIDPETYIAAPGETSSQKKSKKSKKWDATFEDLRLRHVLIRKRTTSLHCLKVNEETKDNVVP